MKLIVVSLLVVSNTICLGQGRSNPASFSFRYGVGYHNQSFGGLNTRVVNRPEYQKLGSSIFSINAGWRIERNHLIFDGCFDFGNSLTGNADKRSTGLSFSGTGLTIGYNLSSNQNVRIYPFAGITYNTYLARFNKDVSAIPFDSVLQSNAVRQRTEPLSFTNGSLCYQAGFGIDFIRQKGKYTRSIGIRAGYSGGFSDESWRINETQLLQNAPFDKVKQFSVSLQFGMGRSRKAGM